MIVHFSFTLPPEACKTPEQVLSHAMPLIPTPAPADLFLKAELDTGLIITYSIDFLNATAAANAIVKALRAALPA